MFLQMINIRIYPMNYLQGLEYGSAVGSQFGVRGLIKELGEGCDGVQFVGRHLQAKTHIPYT